jgi:hypothetical protein
MASEDEVGYGKPPKKTQFKPGESGNPKGRTKGVKNLKTDLVEELQETLIVSESGKRRRISKQRAMVKSLMARAIKGDTRAITLLTTLIVRLLNIDASEGSKELSAEDKAILEAYEKAILARVKAQQMSTAKIQGDETDD